MPHKQYFAGTLLGMSSCASYVSRTHDVIDDVTRSQSRSNFEIDISSSIFKLEGRSKAQNVGNVHGYLSGIFNFRYNFRLKSLLWAQNSGHFDNFEILNTASIWPQIWKDHPKLCPKKYFHDDDVIDDVTGWPQSFSLYSCLGEVGSGSKLQGQCLVNRCQYHNCLSRLYMPKDDLNELHFSRLQVKGQHHRLTGWPWH